MPSHPLPRTAGNIGVPAAQKFNGTSDASLIVSANFTGFTGLSVTYWAIGGFTENPGIVLELSANYNTNNGVFAIFTTPTVYNTAVNSLGSTGTETGATFALPSANVWHHYTHIYNIGATGSGAIPHVYVDGVDQSLTFTATGSTATVFGNFELNIAARNAGSLFSSMAMSNLAIYVGTFLNRAQAQQLFNGADPMSVGPGPTYYWPLSGSQYESNYGIGDHGLNSIMTRFAGKGLTGGPPVLSNTEQMLMTMQNWVGTAAGAPLTPAPSRPVFFSPLTIGAIGAWRVAKAIGENQLMTRRGLLLPRRAAK